VACCHHLLADPLGERAGEGLAAGSGMAWRRAASLLVVVAACGREESSPRDGNTASAADASTDAHLSTDASEADAGGTDGGGIDGAPADASPADARPVDALTESCASAHVGNWTGQTRFWGHGAGSYVNKTANVTWTLASTTGCVDRYAPGGTAHADSGGHCSLEVHPDQTAIGAADGVMIVDRNVSPPSYRIEGTTRWTAMHACTDPAEDNGPFTAVVAWGQHRGVISGDVFGGALPFEAVREVDWNFVRVGATFPPPNGCAGAPVDTISGAHRTIENEYDVIAAVTWTRTSTADCVDQYTPSGTATITGRTFACSTFTVTPSMGSVGAADASLTIDRSTNPPTFTVEGQSRWIGTTTCTDADGTVTTRETLVGDDWGSSGPFTLPVTAGAVARETYDRSWRLSAP
jgi:hypothetical protein